MTWWVNIFSLNIESIFKLAIGYNSNNKPKLMKFTKVLVLVALLGAISGHRLSMHGDDDDPDAK